MLPAPSASRALIMSISNRCCGSENGSPFLANVSFTNCRRKCWVLFQKYQAIGTFAAALFICCMVCHGELYRLRPDPRRLTGFYLSIAAGGALGGAFVAVAAPLLFKGYYELHWGLFLCGVLFLLDNLDILKIGRLLRYWPALLIVLGLYLLYERITETKHEQ